jgi:hypothetical protein
LSFLQKYLARNTLKLLMLGVAAYMSFCTLLYCVSALSFLQQLSCQELYVRLLMVGVAACCHLTVCSYHFYLLLCTSLLKVKITFKMKPAQDIDSMTGLVLASLSCNFYSE